jgi:hypothetical protein
MIKAFFIASQEVSDASRANGMKHCQSLANRHGLFVTSTTKHNFHVTLVTECNQDFTDTVDDGIEFLLGGIGKHPHTWDRFLYLAITSAGIVIETDYAGSIPVFYSQRGGLTLSNIEPCIYLATNSSLNDVSHENLYGFLRYSHFIWDETAWKHIYQMLPDSRFRFTPQGKLIAEEYLETVKASESRCGHSDKQVANELFELNRALVRRSLGDAEDIILPLSSGYDSRMIFSVLSNEKGLLAKTRCFTYGSSGSIEVEGGRRLSKLKGIEWHHIDLPCRFLTRGYLEDTSNIFGASLHMHGMYQMEFFNEIKEKYGVSSATRLTSGFMTGVPAGQHNGLLQITDQDARLTDSMNRFSQSKVWTDEDLSKMPVFKGKNYLEAAEVRFRKAFNRFNGEVHQKAVMFDVWTRQRNFISYYPRVFEWPGSVASPHMCQEYANFFMSLNKAHLYNRKAVELMIISHYPDIAKVASNSNGIRSLNSQFENALFFSSRVLGKLRLPNPLPRGYHNAPIEFDMLAVRNCHEESVYPLLSDYPEIREFMNNFGGASVFRDLYTQAQKGDPDGYARLVTFQAVALNSLLASRYGN